MKRKVLFIICIITMLLLCTGCGKDKLTVDNEALAAPENVKLDEAGNITWDVNADAKYYVVFKGSGRFTNDYEKVCDKLKTAQYTIADDDYSYYKVKCVNKDGSSTFSDAVSKELLMFTENTLIYCPEDDPQMVNDELERLFNKQEVAQFGKNRYAVMFKPGVYSEEIQVKMGFYMDVMGLGKLPTDTKISTFNCTATWLGDDGNHNATCNFWRGVSNLEVDSNVMWAVSQATFMRRMKINGNLAFHDNYGWASGGFLSESLIDGIVDSGSQQQWLSRNCDWNMWKGENWNMVFAGIADGKAPTGTWPGNAYTTVETCPVIQEKPYLYLEDGKYNVFVPELSKDSKGISWENGAVGSSISLDEFYVARADKDTSDTLNEALASGKNLLFTPGIYKLDKELVVSNKDTIVLGIGYATLEPVNGNMCMQVADEEGIKICGILFDAGEVESDTLLQVGYEKNDKDNSASPVLLSDVFFRVGGANVKDTKVKSCVIINSNNVIGDNFWVWRADHGDGVAWNKNTAANGIIVNGDNVTIYALMVEHFQQYQTVWNGENGSVYFYQSELPYDVPKQSEWRSHDGNVNGYASYYVADNVENHTAYGIGIYSYNRDAIVEEFCAMEVPEKDGMNLHNVCAIMITGNPGISYVINTYGDHAYYGGVRSIIVDFQKVREERLNSVTE